MTISATKANRLFWLGRYVERVYMTLHLLRRVNDQMIDGKPEDYESFKKKLDMADSYATAGEFTLGMLYDDENPSSVISSLVRAMDNAIMLREDITSETMSYIEMSISMMKKMRRCAEDNITNLQSVTDWMLAFRGSAAQRIEEPRMLSIIAIGQLVEKIDMMLRFSYTYDRIATQYTLLKTWSIVWPELIDEQIVKNLEDMLQPSAYENAGDDFNQTMCKYINCMVRV